jgi:PRTRC genetic system protein E
MFAELKKLLLKRSVTITVAGLDNEQIRVNVVPHERPEDKKANQQISYSHKGEVAPVPEDAIKALTTPLSITGAAEEIDAGLPAILSEYVESHLNLQASFDRASDEIAEAVKAIDERNKAKAKEKSAKKGCKDKDNDKEKGEEAKPDETLPLWWTDKSAAAPGAAPATSIPVEDAATPK